ncbi:MAG: tRNA (adenosine(37)-N6)-threonylcarbamoyltransferase complex ATPase subunit type 1 TsaE [Paracoccaceae bacterium]|nr:tRNA (adenosine(37)-N6)-threonylcarbamoyltransferase complex ATPase subunit type 1 TsaE [Paracoccaceae bacterium]
MTNPLFHFVLADEDATANLASLIAPHLKAGDTLLLEGAIGAGKSAFARALIRARLGRMEDVPSPTFTLVQTYEDASADIWHCDLYRLTHPDEALELGLDEAFETAICLIEWPDRLGDVAPKTALRLAFSAEDHAHKLTISGPPPWGSRLRGLHD